MSDRTYLLDPNATYGVLGQNAPPADTDTDLYTVPASIYAAGELTVCNRGSVDAEIRVAVRPAGATLANEHYVYYGARVGPAATLLLEGTIVAGPTDVVTVRASTADVSFSLLGWEKSA